MVRIRILLLLIFLSTVACLGEEPMIWMGMTRAQVEDTLGYPEARATAGRRSILFFKDGARFEFENNILISVRGYKGQIEFTTMPADKMRGAAVSETPKPVNLPAPKPAAPAPEKKDLMERQDDLPNYTDLNRPAVSTLEQVVRLFYAIYNPLIFDAQKRLQPLGLPILAGLIRMAMTFYALRAAIRRSDRDLEPSDLIFMAGSEWCLRVAVATLGVFTVKGGFPLLASELGATFLFWMLLSRRPELHGWWLSLRITLFTRLAVLAVSFVLFMILLNMSI